MQAKVVRLRNRPRTFTAPEQVIEELSDMILSCGDTYRQIAQATDLSPETVRRAASRQTTWPRPKTLFSLLTYFGVGLTIDRS